MFGTADLATALVLIALAATILLAMLSYHSPHRHFVSWGIGVLVFATVLALLTHALTQPGISTSLVLLMVSVAAMMVMLTYHSQKWGHAVWWTGVVLFLLALPLLGAGRGDLALIGLIGGPGLLMLVAALQPQVPAFYSNIGAPDERIPTREDLSFERRRYTRLAGVITLASLAGVWLFGGVPRGEVIEAAAPLTVDDAAALRGAELFQQYGCLACHSVTSAAPGVGPGLLGIGNRRERLDDGTTVLASEEYIRESILQPDAKTVSGYAKGVMSAAIAGNASEIRQTNNIQALVEYLKSLK